MTYTIVIDAEAYQLAACIPNNNDLAMRSAITNYLSQCNPKHKPNFITMTIRFGICHKIWHWLTSRSANQTQFVNILTYNRR